MFGDLCKAEENGGAILDSGTVFGGDFEDTGVIIRMSAKGELASPYLDAGVEDAETAVDEEVVESRDCGGVVQGEDVVNVEMDCVLGVFRRGCGGGRG